MKLRHAAALSPQNVAAICQLTASAVPGLSPEQVSLVDTNGNLLNRPRAGTRRGRRNRIEAALDYRKGVEHDLQNKIAATLDPLLGAGSFSRRRFGRSGSDQRRAERRGVRSAPSP